MSAHARLSPSAAARWMTCPGSVRLTEHLPRTSSEFAAEGTAAHELAEKVLRSGGSASDHVGLTITADGFSFVVDQTMADFVQIYVDQVRGCLEGDLNVEQRVDLSDIYGEEGGGTADAFVYRPDTRSLHGFDLKYGRGELVDASTPQGKLYILGMINKLRLDSSDLDTITFTIVQPRIGHIQTVTYTYDDLMDFADEVRKAAAETRKPDAALVASEKGCRWCGVKATCPVLAKEAANVVSVFPVVEASEVSNENLWVPETLTDDQLGAIHGKLGMIRDWVAAVETEVYARMESGRAVPGWKMVAGRRGNKQWKDEDEAVDALIDLGVDESQLFSKKFISPSQAESLIGKSAFGKLADHVYQADGKPTVVPEDDKRPALKSSSVFKALS